MSLLSVPLKRVLSRNDGGVWGDDPTGDGDTVVLRSTEQTMDGEWKLTDPAFRHLTAVEAAASRLQLNDLLVTKSSGSDSHIGKTTLVNARVAALKPAYSNFMQRLRVDQQSDPTFYWYVMRSAEVRDQLSLTSTTTTGLGNLTGGILGSLLVPAPSLEEQRQIAKYLDRETGKIDTLIAKQEQLVATLTERRRAAIADAVTHGLHPDVQRKASDRQWFDSIPSHWLVGSVKHFGEITLGKMVQPDQLAPFEGLAPYMRAANIQPDGKIEVDDVKEMWFSPTELAGLSLEVGDVVVVEGGIGGFGRAAYLASKLLGWGFQNSINRIRPRGSEGRYLAYVLIAARAAGYISAVCPAVSMPHFTAEKLAKFPVPMPPRSEQVEISDHLDAIAASIDKLIDRSQGVMMILRERRQALISAAVTGKIDVRGL